MQKDARELKLTDVENRKKIQKLKFCIITNFKSQFSRNNLLLFTLDNNK